MAFYAHDSSRHCTNRTLCDFNEFVEQLSNIWRRTKEDSINIHFRPQARIAGLDLANSSMRFDFMGRLESEADRAFLWEGLIGRPMVHVHRSSPLCVQPSNHTLALVRKLYARDYALLDALDREPTTNDSNLTAYSCAELARQRDVPLGRNAPSA